MGDLVDHIISSSKTCCFEKYPAETNKMESNKNGNGIVPPAIAYFGQALSGDRRPYFMHGQCDAMHCPPDNKIPAGPMPETTKQHCYQQVQARRSTCLLFFNNSRKNEYQQYSNT